MFNCSTNNFNFGLAQPTILIVIIKDVLNIMKHRICAQLIKTQMIEEKQNSIHIIFILLKKEKGIVDCTDSLCSQHFPQSSHYTI